MASSATASAAQSKQKKRQRTESGGGDTEDGGGKVGITWVLAVDGSEHGRKAFEWTFNALHKKRDQLYIVTVVEEVHSQLPKSAYFTKMQDEMNKQLHSQAREFMKPFDIRCQAEKVQHESLILTAPSAKDAIVDFAFKVDADTLVISRRGLSELEKMVLGSVSDYCIKHAPCNVVLIK